MNHRMIGIYLAVCTLGMASIFSAACSDDSSPGATGGTSGATSGGTSGATSGGTSGATSGGTSGATSGGTSGATSGGTSGDPGDSGTDSGADAAALCDPTIPAGAQEFTETYTAAQMPAMGTATGGEIASGTYFQTEKRNYDKASGVTPKRRGVLTVDATAKTFTLAGSDEGTVSVRGGTYSIAGNKLTLNFTCPVTATATFDFTYNAPKFELYNYGDKHINGFTKQ